MLLQLLDSNPLSLGLVLARQIVKASWPGLAPEVQAQGLSSLPLCNGLYSGRVGGA